MKNIYWYTKYIHEKIKKNFSDTFTTIIADNTRIDELTVINE